MGRRLVHKGQLLCRKQKTDFAVLCNDILALCRTIEREDEQNYLMTRVLDLDKLSVLAANDPNSPSIHIYDASRQHSWEFEVCVASAFALYSQRDLTPLPPAIWVGRNYTRQEQMDQGAHQHDCECRTNCHRRFDGCFVLVAKHQILQAQVVQITTDIPTWPTITVTIIGQQFSVVVECCWLVLRLAISALHVGRRHGRQAQQQAEGTIVNSVAQSPRCRRSTLDHFELQARQLCRRCRGSRTQDAVADRAPSRAARQARQRVVQAPRDRGQALGRDRTRCKARAGEQGAPCQGSSARSAALTVPIAIAIAIAIATLELAECHWCCSRVVGLTQELAIGRKHTRITRRYDALHRAW